MHKTRSTWRSQMNGLGLAESGNCKLAQSGCLSVSWA